MRKHYRPTQKARLYKHGDLRRLKTSIPASQQVTLHGPLSTSPPVCWVAEGTPGLQLFPEALPASLSLHYKPSHLP